MKNSVVLIGYRCTGKSSVGRALARRLDVPFHDSDDLITASAGMTIADIVHREGWEGFRERECAAVAALATRRGAVIALGGGALDNPRNQDVLKKEACFLVWLSADRDTILARMAADETSDALRPPLTGTDRAAETALVLERREPVYRKMAGITIDTSKKDIETIVEELCHYIETNKE